MLPTARERETTHETDQAVSLRDIAVLGGLNVNGAADFWAGASVSQEDSREPGGVGDLTQL